MYEETNISKAELDEDKTTRSEIYDIHDDDSDEDETIDDLKERIGLLNVTIQDLRNTIGGKDRYIDMQRKTIDDLTTALQEKGAL